MGFPDILWVRLLKDHYNDIRTLLGDDKLTIHRLKTMQCQDKVWKNTIFSITVKPLSNWYLLPQKKHHRQKLNDNVSPRHAVHLVQEPFGPAPEPIQKMTQFDGMTLPTI